MQVQIKFTVFGCCSAIGNFGPGDTARVSAAMAAHLVDEARCAKYVTAPELARVVVDDSPVAVAPKQRKRKAK